MPCRARPLRDIWISWLCGWENGHGYGREWMAGRLTPMYSNQIPIATAFKSFSPDCDVVGCRFSWHGLITMLTSWNLNQVVDVESLFVFSNANANVSVYRYRF